MTEAGANYRIDLLGFATDAGAAVRGAVMGPEALRIAGLAEALEALGHTVEDRGDFRVPPAPRTAEKRRAELIKDATLLEGAAGFNSDLFGIARTLLRAAEERPKPAGDRLREFADARLPSLEHALFSDEPHYDDFETLKLADSLTLLATTYGATSDLVKAVLAGKSPQERAFELVSGTKLHPALKWALVGAGFALQLYLAFQFGGNRWVG